MTVRQVFAKGWPRGIRGKFANRSNAAAVAGQGADALSDFTTRDGRRVLAHAVLRRLQLGRPLRRRRARVRVRGHRSRSGGRANAQRFARRRLGARLEPLRRPRRFLERRRVLTARRRVSLASRDFVIIRSYCLSSRLSRIRSHAVRSLARRRAVAVASSREDLASSVSHLPHVAPRVAPRVASSRHESHRVNAMEIQRRRRRS